MIVEVIAVGTELLLGQIVNTNASDIGSRLAEDGFDVHFQGIVGDNLDRIVASIDMACSRADAVILTGGIGPTQDDMTRDALCVLLDVSVVRDPEHEQRIRDRLRARGATAKTALKMADYPAGTEPLANRKGVALGIAAKHNDTLIFAVPGVPTEMRVMIDEQVRPRLREASGEPSVLSSSVLHCWGPGEARIAEMLDDLYSSENPSIAFLVTASEIKVRVTAKAASSEEADKMISSMNEAIKSRLGKYVFGSGNQSVDTIILERLTDLGWTISTIEMTTAGLIAARLATAPQFVGGTVLPAESCDDVEAQAEQLLEANTPADADVTLVISSASGEADGHGTAQRRVAIAVRTPENTQVKTLTFLGDDERVRSFAVASALHVLRSSL